MKLLKIIFLLLFFVGGLIGCEPKTESYEQQVNNSNLITILKTMGYRFNGNKIIVDDKVIQTVQLDLTDKKLTDIDGIEVFENLQILILNKNLLKNVNVSRLKKLTTLSLKENPQLESIFGLDPSLHTSLQILELPYAMRYAMGTVPGFVKKMLQSSPKTFKATIESGENDRESKEYTYYYLFKNTVLVNHFFRTLGEENFLVMSVDGKKTEVLDMSKKILFDSHIPIDLNIQTSHVKDYQDVEMFINSAMKFSGINLRRFSISTDTPKYLERFPALDFSGYTNLELVSIDNMPVDRISLKGCSRLKTVMINRSLVHYSVPKPMTIAELDLSDSPNIKKLHLGFMPLQRLKLHQAFKPDTLQMDSLKINSIENFNAASLKFIKITGTPISFLPELGNDLKYLWIEKTNLTGLDLRKCVNLTDRIQLEENNKLTVLSLPEGDSMECDKIEIYKNKLTKLDFSRYKKIGYLATATYKRFTSEGKGAEENLTEFIINPEALLSDLVPRKDKRGYPIDAMTIAVDKELLKKSATLKRFFEEKGGKPVSFYKYGFRGSRYVNLGTVNATDFN